MPEWACKCLTCLRRFLHHSHTAPSRCVFCGSDRITTTRGGDV